MLLLAWKRTLQEFNLNLNFLLFIAYSVQPCSVLWTQINDSWSMSLKCFSSLFTILFFPTILFSLMNFHPTILFIHMDIITTSLTGHLAVWLSCSLQICMCNILLAVYISLKCLILFINVFSIQLFTLNHQEYESVSVSSYMV